MEEEDRVFQVLKHRRGRSPISGDLRCFLGRGIERRGDREKARESSSAIAT